MSNPLLTVHVGTFKTGTTAIQKLLARNRQFLEANHGILYPRTAEIGAGGHHNLVYELTGSWKYNASLGGFKELETEFVRSSATSLILSAENLSSYALTNPGIAPAFARLADDLGCELRAICYVRPQWEYIDSYYSQGVKSGYTTRSFESFVQSALSEALYDYEKVVKPWEDLQVSVIVRPYVGRKTATDFFENTGIPLLHERPTELAEGVNVRFGAKRLDFMRRMGSAFERAKMPVRQRIPMARRLREIVEKSEIQDVPFTGLDAHLVGAIEANFRASNSRLSERYDMGSDWLQLPPQEKLIPSAFDWRTLNEEDIRAFDDAIVQLLRATNH